MTQEQSRYSNLRDSFTALREFIVVVAMLSLLFVPGRVRAVLDDAGIRSLAGVEFDTQELEKSERAVEDAQRNVAKLRRELSIVKDSLFQAKQTQGIQARFDLEDAFAHLDTAQREIIETEANLNQCAETNLNILQRHGINREQKAIAQQSYEVPFDLDHDHPTQPYSTKLDDALLQR